MLSASSPRGKILCRFSTRQNVLRMRLYTEDPCVYACKKFTYVCERSCSTCQSSVDCTNTKTPSMHRRFSSTTLSQRDFHRESDPNFPWEKSQWNDIVVKRKESETKLTAGVQKERQKHTKVFKKLKKKGSFMGQRKRTWNFWHIGVLNLSRQQTNGYGTQEQWKQWNGLGLRLCLKLTFGVFSCMAIEYDLLIMAIIIIIINPSTARAVVALQMIFQPVFSIFPCSPQPSGTYRTPGLSTPWCCLPTSSSVCLVFFSLSLCLAK